MERQTHLIFLLILAALSISVLIFIQTTQEATDVAPELMAK
ncbi:MAG: hypothetical protein QG570_689 [Patescibacteria group bacterium]|nr:hypothetical protein [Patescibacteria group bacterium]